MRWKIKNKLLCDTGYFDLCLCARVVKIRWVKKADLLSGYKDTILWIWDQPFFLCKLKRNISKLTNARQNNFYVLQFFECDKTYEKGQYGSAWFGLRVYCLYINKLHGNLNMVGISFQWRPFCHNSMWMSFDRMKILNQVITLLFD